MVTKATTILLVLDEAGALETSFRVTLKRQQLVQLTRALRRANVRDSVREEWVYQSTLLTQAETRDLRKPDWRLPSLSLAETTRIQEAGLHMDSHFHWPGNKLQAFTCSRRNRRWADEKGIHFIAPPYLADNTLVLSAGMSNRYVERQLGVGQVHNPFPQVRAHHKSTRFYNLAFLHGSARRFPGNLPQILDAFAQLILHNIQRELRTLLVSRKHLKQRCIAYLVKRLTQWGYPVTFVPSRGEPPSQKSPTCIPVIHFGITGVNSFEDYHAVYCLNSYYLDEDVLQQAISDVEESDLDFPVRIKLNGKPPRHPLQRSYRLTTNPQHCDR